jgi:hypothetical protein
MDTRLVTIACLIGGHDDFIRRTRSRLYLRCERCGRETAGWAVGPAAARQHVDGRLDQGAGGRQGAISAVVAHFSQKV